MTPKASARCTTASARDRTYENCWNTIVATNVHIAFLTAGFRDLRTSATESDFSSSPFLREPIVSARGPREKCQLTRGQSG